MRINTATLDAAFTGFKTVYNMSFEAAKSHASEIAMTISSQSREEEYGWLGYFPELREWIDERRIQQLSKHGFTIKNKKFESTVRISRDDFADDKLGLHKPKFSEMGRAAKIHKDKLVFGLLKAGFETMCFDGQNYFDHDHPVLVGDEEISVSNMQDGDGPGWFLLDTSREVRPIIWQEREPYEFQAVTAPDDQHVFLRDEYLYGIRARVNAGLGLWQLAYASKAPLTSENYSNARSEMMKARASDGQLLGVIPSVLVVSPEHEAAARNILKADQIDGSSNIWRDSADLIVSFDVAA